MDFSIIFLALSIGILPAIIWLVFWLREDAQNPEPIGLIIKTFVAGGAVVVLVLPVQVLVDRIFPGMGVMAFTFWAFSEEAFKFLAAYYVAIRGREDNEPLDPMMYMIVVALGFVAVENVLFIMNPLLQEDMIVREHILEGLLTGNMRFIGASLLHIVSSATIGVALSLNFYKTKLKKISWGIFSFLLAVIIHTVFNLFIINQKDVGIFLTFGTVWAGITILLLIFEKVKTIKSPQASGDTISTGNTSTTI
ncbi:MAG: hypothetical protein AB200_00070 [Parcubacteria bacterium C7867-005]|nr:MAG: hypothetical protein AB200_00070 [Parcubacteria bacterium C7867-005]